MRIKVHVPGAEWQQFLSMARGQVGRIVDGRILSGISSQSRGVAELVFCYPEVTEIAGKPVYEPGDFEPLLALADTIQTMPD